jgi:hypothetical protein
VERVVEAVGIVETLVVEKLALDEVVVGVTGKVAVVADTVASTYSSALKIEE